MSKKQQYNYAQLLKFIEGAEYVNPWYEEKNRKIRENGKATRERHARMDCRVISVRLPLGSG